MVEVQVFEGEGINWQEPPEGPHIATVQAGGYNEPCRVWVQHNANGGGGVRFMGISPDNQISAYLNTMFSRANNRASMNQSHFDMTVGVWHCKGCQVTSTRRDKSTDTIDVNVTTLTRRS